ncbi:MAG: 50S ribosomal protein L29 [Leptospirales bacterium]|nr:50S ribosomal protein L29 [Leptospirales bacterium]
MAKALHEMADADLHKLIDDSRSQLRELRFQFGVARSLPNPASLRTIRRTMAGALTVLNERKLGIATQKAATPGKAGKAEKKKAEPKAEAKAEKKPAKKAKG